MKVKELKTMLDTYPDNMEVITDLWSDYGSVNDVRVVFGVAKDGWIMRSHPTMSEENEAKKDKYLLISVSF